MDKAEETMADLKAKAAESEKNLERKLQAQNLSRAPIPSPKKSKTQRNKEEDAAKAGVPEDPEKHIEEMAKRVTEKVNPQAFMPKGDFDKSVKSGQAAVQFIREKKAAQEKDKKEETEQFIYFVECQDTTCLGPGIWIHEEPNGAYDHTKVEASYKPLGQPYMGEHYYCQVCLEVKGTKKRLLHLKYGNGIGPLPRVVRKMKRANYERMMGKTPVGA